MNSSNDNQGLKLEIKSLKDDIDFYKSKLEIIEFKLKEQIIKNHNENAELKRRLTQATDKSTENAELKKRLKQVNDELTKTESKKIKPLLNQIETLVERNSILESKIVNLKDQIKKTNLLKKQTKNSSMKMKNNEFVHYLVNILEDIIDDDGTLMPSVAMRIRGYTKQLKDGAGLIAIQPFLEELIYFYNDVKFEEKASLKKIK
jgi:chromosome segregation ATPase